MASDDVLTTVDLPDEEYTVVQSLIRNKYKALDASGDVVLRGKQKMFKMKEEFPFVDGDGEEAFTVKAGGILDIAGDYTLVDAGTEEPVAVLDENFTLFHDKWKIRDADGEEILATIESSSKLVSFLRHLVSIFSLIPHSYDVETPDGEEIGTIAGQFSLKDTYEVTIGDTGDAPREAVVAAAMVIDAIEGN